MNRPRLKTLKSREGDTLGALVGPDSSPSTVMLMQTGPTETKDLLRFLTRHNRLTMWTIGNRRWSLHIVRDDNPDDKEEG